MKYPLQRHNANPVILDIIDSTVAFLTN